MKKSLPFLSPYLMLVFPIVMLLGFTLIHGNQSVQNKVALENTFLKSEQIVHSPKVSSSFVKHLLKK